MKKLMLCILLLAGCSNWTRKQIIAQELFFTSLAIDGLQSGVIVRDCRETNTIVGRCGQNISLGVYMPVTGIAELVLAHAFPRLRYILPGLGISTEAYAVSSNVYNGYGL